MSQAGRINFSRMESVTFGKPAAEVVAEEARKVGAERVFLMVSNTLNNKTDEIEKVRRALGNLCAGTYDTMSPHTPRGDVIAATRMAREAQADLIVTVGGGSITDGAKAVLLCLANDIDAPEDMDVLSPVARPDGTVGPRPEVKGRQSNRLCRRRFRAVSSARFRALPTSGRVSKNSCATRISSLPLSCWMRP